MFYSSMSYNTMSVVRTSHGFASDAQAVVLAASVSIYYCPQSTRAQKDAAASAILPLNSLLFTPAQQDDMESAVAVYKKGGHATRTTLAHGVIEKH